MSGGDWDYCYRHLHDIAEKLDTQECQYRLALAHIMRNMAHIMKAIEWTDGADISPEDQYYEMAHCLFKIHSHSEVLLEKLSDEQQIELDFSQGPDYE